MRARLIFATLFLSGCAGQSGTPPIAAPTIDTREEQRLNTPPKISLTTARRLILKNRSALFKDPDSIRDAKISQPFTCYGLGGDCICLELNGRNSYGGFTGLQLIGMEIHEPDRVENIGEMGPRAIDDTCGKTLSPFPELNGRKSG